jgi:hypothetical protein
VKIKAFYENYSAVASIVPDENDQEIVSVGIQEQIELFLKNREEKRLAEIERKKMLEQLAIQKKKEEEEQKIAKKKSEEAAAAAEAQRVMTRIRESKKFLFL